MAPRRKQHRIEHSKAVAYLRVSTDKQDETCDAQRAAIKRDAARRGVQIASWHVDAGVSGAAPAARRPGFQDALQAMQAAGATLFLIAKPDRLARGNASLFESLEYAVVRAGGVLGYADGTTEQTGAAAEFQREIMRAVAKLERGFIAERTSAALQAKKARGERYNRTIPYGFRLSFDGVHLERDAAEQAVLSEMRAWRDGGLSLRAVTARLNERYKPRVAKAWHLTTVAELLRREVFQAQWV